MYAAMQRRPDGTWVGPSAPDGVQRIHAFRPVPGRQLAVVVAVNETEAMRPAAGLAQDVRSLAIAATLVALAAIGDRRSTRYGPSAASAGCGRAWSASNGRGRQRAGGTGRGPGLARRQGRTASGAAGRHQRRRTGARCGTACGRMEPMVRRRCSASRRRSSSAACRSTNCCASRCERVCSGRWTTSRAKWQGGLILLRGERREPAAALCRPGRTNLGGVRQPARRRQQAADGARPHRT